ncbi:MAG: D-alanyl-D-alanine carboxypeptidase/D-alanyl-D-alanine-endopeptidase [Actinobacteria bacterium]|nr:MAG: D-alanyl-D-alanine carboxypeptidase/D-alanyl-D-alanine-endopeptidase [Actinomycetota bacterium]
MRIRRPLTAALAAAATLPAAATASPESDLGNSLSRDMRAAGRDSGAVVRDQTTGKRLFAWNAGTARILASNTKLFTLGATLARRGPRGTIATRVMAAHALRSNGVVKGNLYLVGGGDPAFGSQSFVDAHYGGGNATVERLASKLHAAGLRAVQGHVVGDESLFDSLRGGPSSGYRASRDDEGPLTALVYNHGLTASGYFQTDPPSYAADRLTDALRRLGISVGQSATSGRTHSGAAELARVKSLPMNRIAELTGKPSDNYFAEILAKGIGGGTTSGGARAIVRFAKQRGAKVTLHDGSGLSHDNKANPRDIVRYLLDERSEPESKALFGALPIAGVDGTLAHRMTSGYAHRNCRAKTGTLTGVSALSGYCRSRSNHVLFFSILMNGQSSDSHAHSLQDDMAQHMAGYNG